MFQQLGNEVERQGKQVCTRYTQETRKMETATLDKRAAEQDYIGVHK